jgi:hypothetical protein
VEHIVRIEEFEMNQPNNQYPGSSLKLFLTPLSKQKGWPVWMIYLLALFGVIYVLNPTGGFIEFLPDNLPIIGNLDEGVAYLLVWYGVVEFFEGRKK